MIHPSAGRANMVEIRMLPDEA